MSQARLFQFFEEELAYLASAGPRFARRHPERASLVSLDNVTSRDPDVERLVQAFAFLAGQVRAEIHDELPELTHSLLDLLWPQYLKPFPSSAVVELKPDLGQLQGPHHLPAGSASFESIPITSPETGRDFTCRFRNIHAIDLLPLAIRSAEVRRLPSRSELVLEFEIGPNADPQKMWSSVRLHLAGDPVVALEMRYWMLAQTDGSRIHATIKPPEGPTRSAPLGPFCSVGFDPRQTVNQPGRLSFPGYRLVQDYFLAKHRFLYVDLAGWDKLGPLEAGSKISVHIPLLDHPPTRVKFTSDTLRLHCVPVVNLFRSSALPIRYDGRRHEYPIHVENDSQSVALYRILRAYGQAQGETGIAEYSNFLDFKVPSGSTQGFYQASIRPGVDGRPEWKIMLTRPGGVIRPQVLSLDVECCNGELAAALLPGDIRYRGEGCPEFVEVKSLTQPESIYFPPLESASAWRFISHLALNYLTLEDADSLVGALKLYDWTPSHANWRRLEGVKSLKGAAGVAMVDGIPLRGRDVDVELDVNSFANLGDAHLFSEILSNFLAIYSNTNSYTRLTASVNQKQIFRWPALNGSQKPI